MKKIWVAVADEAITRILQWPETGQELESVEELTDADAHAEGSDLRRDAQGRRSGGASPATGGNGANRSHGIAGVTASAGEDEQHLEAQAFAKRVAAHLGAALQKKRFDELQIIAAPRFLGLLRKALDAQVAAVVSLEVNKDLVHLENSEITQHLTAAKHAARGTPPV